MVSEKICLSVITFMRGRSLMLTTTLLEKEPTKSTDNDAATPSDIYKHLLSRYKLGEIDASMKWLEICGYISRSGVGMMQLYWHVLTDKGRLAADSLKIPEEDKQFLYQEEEPYSVFVAHQFNKDDLDLVSYIREKVLIPHGFSMLEGRADGLEEFRASILTKIKRARFFICLLTKRIELASGTFVSSVWLY